MLRTHLRVKRPLSVRQLSSSARRWNLDSKSTNSSANPSKNPPQSEDTHSEPEAGPSTRSYSSQSSHSPETTSSSNQQSETHHKDADTGLDLDILKTNIRKWTDTAAINFRRRADDFTGSTKTTFSQLGAELNKFTGYDEIDALKRQVVAQEAKIQEVRQAARDAKTRYEQAVIQRSNSQRELNDLLQRKTTWTDHDVIRFTTLVREDHSFVQEESRAKTAVDETEEAVEREFNELTRSILTRYHEEQVWSDKIRSASTYGQLAALGLNLLVFILAIIVVEPWKRRRLAQTFEKKIEEMELEYKAAVEENMKEIQQQLNGQIVSLTVIAEAVARLDTQLQRTRETTEQEVDEPVEMENGTWAKAVKDRHFGEAVATGAVVATLISALGWIYWGG